MKLTFLDFTRKFDLKEQTSKPAKIEHIIPCINDIVYGFYMDTLKTLNNVWIVAEIS